MRAFSRLRIFLIFVLLATSTFLLPPSSSHVAVQGAIAAIDAIYRLPFQDPPGPHTWLLGQAYGNTISAYYNRNTFYTAGQGLHFGIDFPAACGYPVLAIGDGVVAKVDALEHGSGPHNLIIDHPEGYASLYGHLLETPALSVGQDVRQGEIIAKVGDPDETCTSRPHLHLEIRNAGLYDHAYNPIPLIAADWHSLSLVGPTSQGFARDIDNPRQWQRLDDQPETDFGGVHLNNYPNPWPMGWSR